MKKVRNFYKGLTSTKERVAFFWFWSVVVVFGSIFIGAAVADIGFLAFTVLAIYFILLVGAFASAYVLCNRSKPTEQPAEDNWEDLL